VHHDTQLVSMTPNCGVCHQDHKGAHHDLKRVADARCTDCHKDIHKSMQEGKKTDYLANITSFAEQHPTFHSTKSDPGRLKFNHLYHMTEGIRLSKEGKPFLISDMKESEQKNAILARAKGNSKIPVKMDCADCHTPETVNQPVRPATDDLLSAEGQLATQNFFHDRQQKRGWFDGPESDVLRPPHKTGAYMAPVKFESHCAACHPLTFAPEVPALKHGLQPDKLRHAVEELVEDRKLEEAIDQVLKTKPAAIPLPGKLPASKSLSREGKVDLVMRSLMEGQRVCGECHVEVEGKTVSDLTIHSKEIARPNVPAEWFKHARFDHGKHQEVSCRECHPQADPYKGNQWDEKGVLAAYAMPRKGAEVVMMPTIDNCRQCHSPNPTEDAVKRNLAAKSDCTECHGYHNGKK
jgi:hypothetical protein